MAVKAVEAGGRGRRRQAGRGAEEEGYIQRTLFSRHEADVVPCCTGVVPRCSRQAASKHSKQAQQASTANKHSTRVAGKHSKQSAASKHAQDASNLHSRY